ncbi:hypothetical protein BJF79_15450 [Actinomadura sp. CNU-125]|nr:hypothetical protein BJF79_15450 [Actinomadura sp. CNU-125]
MIIGVLKLVRRAPSMSEMTRYSIFFSRQKTRRFRYLGSRSMRLLTSRAAILRQEGSALAWRAMVLLVA